MITDIVKPISGSSDAKEKAKIADNSLGPQPEKLIGIAAPNITRVKRESLISKEELKLNE